MLRVQSLVATTFVARLFRAREASVISVDDGMRVQDAGVTKNSY